MEQDEDGSFLELPIASSKVSPIFYWKLAFTRLMKNDKHQSFGNGNSVPASKLWLIKKLSIPSTLCASIDGYKVNCLKKAFVRQKEKQPNSSFIILGHPKSLTEYSINKFRLFIEDKISKHNFSTFSKLVENKEIEIPININE